MRDLFLINTPMVVDGLESCGLLEDYCDVLSAVWTLIVTAPIRCRGSIVMLNFTKSVLMKKQTHLHLGWPAGEYVFSIYIFWGELFL